MKTSNPKFYDVKDVTLTFGGVTVKGFAPNTFLIYSATPRYWVKRQRFRNRKRRHRKDTP